MPTNLIRFSIGIKPDEEAEWRKLKIHLEQKLDKRLSVTELIRMGIRELMIRYDVTN